MKSHFFAYIARMRYITRWALMRNTFSENVQEHSHMVAVLAHALAVIRNRVYGGQVDAGQVAAVALYHDASEIITGFPEETEEEFGETLAFIEKCGFAAMHIFPYSVRPGTKAAAMAQVDMSVREERAARAAAVAERMHQGYLARCVGKTFPVLFERDRRGGSAGHAPNYMEVSVAQEGLHNQVRNVRITAADGGSLRGELEE